MDARNSVAALGMGIGVALLFAMMNGLSTYAFGGSTITEKTVERFGGSA